jgi:hypothetical protein
MSQNRKEAKAVCGELDYDVSWPSGAEIQGSAKELNLLID